MNGPFFDWCASEFAGPDEVAARYLDDAKEAAAQVGALLDAVPVLDGRRHYLRELSGAKSTKHYYKGSLSPAHRDGTIWPMVTFKTFKGGGHSVGWCPRDLAWQDFERNRGLRPALTAEQRSAAMERTAKLLAEAEASRQAAEEEERGLVLGAKEKAKHLWSVARPGVSADHPYLAKKGIRPVGAKQLKERVVVPLFADGELWNLQFIGADGKTFLTNGRVGGCYMVAGADRLPAEAATVLLCEGWATGCSLFSALGLPVVVGFAAGNLPEVAKTIRGLLPAARLVLCADLDASGAGRLAAERAAVAAGSAVIVLPDFGVMPVPAGASDFNDLHRLSGIQAVREQVQAALSGPDWQAPAVAREPEPEARPEPSEPAQRLELKDDRGRGFRVVQYVKGMANGVYWQPPAEEGKEPPKPVWLCDPLWVEAEVRNEEQGDWGRLLSWFDRDRCRHEWACPVELLEAVDTSEFRRVLARQGLVMGSSNTARRALADYVRMSKPQQPDRIRCVTKSGWFGDCYVLGSTVFGQYQGGRVVYQGRDSCNHDRQGDLAGWRSTVAAMAAGNSRIVFAIASSFAGVLVEMAGESGGGFTFTGLSSRGKTSTLIDPAASVWGHPERFARRWHTTANGLESLCLSRNDLPLILDDLGQCDAKDAGKAAYNIANGQEKSRMSSSLKARPVATWKTLLLSTGEIDLAELMAQAGKEPKLGQVIRMPSIPADAGAEMGVLEQLHQQENPKAFADVMKAQARACYGTAGPAFLQVLTDAGELAEVRRLVRGAVSALVDGFAIPSAAPPEVGRVAARFALVAYAGELATRYGVTGWAVGEATKAAKACFADWLSESGSLLGSDAWRGLERLRGTFGRYLASRFPWAGANSDELAKVQNLMGLKNYLDHGPAAAFEILFIPAALKEAVLSGLSHREVLGFFADKGYLVAAKSERSTGTRKGQQRYTQKRRVSAYGGIRASFYVFDPKVMDE